MRVAVYYHDDVLANKGSASEFIKTLCEELSHYFIVALFAYGDVIKSRVVQMTGYDYYVIRRSQLNQLFHKGQLLRKVFNAASAHLPVLYYHSKIFDPDIAICVDPYVGLTTTALAKWDGKPVVYRPNDSLFLLSDQLRQTGNLLVAIFVTIYAVFVTKLIASKADLILPSSSLISEYKETGVQSLILPYCPPEIHPKTPERITQSVVRQELGLPTDKKILLFLGTGNWEPNCRAINFIIQTLAPGFVDSVPDALFLIVGQHTETYRSSSNPSNVMIVGGVDSVRPWIEAADFGLAPLDLVIGIPAKLVMYLTRGLPVIATKEAGSAISSQLGLYLSTLDQFHSLVARLIRDGNVPDRSVIAQAASARYSIHSNVARLLPILRRLEGVSGQHQVESSRKSVDVGAQRL